MSTQQNSRRAASSSSVISVVNVSRSRLRSTSSASPGSWIGSGAPERNDSIFSASMSTATTRWPTSAKQAAVTRPTQPTPMTPIVGFSLAFTVPGSYFSSSSRIEVAIESIWPSSSDCSSVLLTQYAALPVFQPTSLRRSPS